MMMLGIVITFFAVRKTEGLLWGRTSPFNVPMVDRLDFNPSEIQNDIEIVNVQQRLRIASRAADDFANSLRASDILEWSGLNNSAVHTLRDVEVQAKLLCLPSINDIDEIRTKSHLTYFGHWMDDICDGGHLPVIEKIIENEGHAPQLTEVFPDTGNGGLDRFIETTLERIGKEHTALFLKLGFQRLLLGSLILSDKK